MKFSVTNPPSTFQTQCPTIFLSTSFEMSSLVQISLNFSAFRSPLGDKFKKPINDFPLLRRNRFKLRAIRESWCFLGVGRGKDGILVKDERWKRKRRLVVVRFNQENSSNARVLGNLALAVGLTYLTMTGQLGWILDAIVSIWLIVVIVPILGLGAFLWWAGRDIVQDSCPNCGNDFQIFKSSLNDQSQSCPFCGQPFSVVGNEFVKDSVDYSNQSTTFGQTFDELFSSRSKKGKGSSTGVVDIEAEIKDAD